MKALFCAGVTPGQQRPSDIVSRYNDLIISLHHPNEPMFALPFASQFASLFASLSAPKLHVALSQPKRALRLGWGLLAVVAASALVGCGSFNSASGRVAGIVSPYKIDIVQGNFVSKEQAEAVKVGMTRGQIREILGTPLLASMFHADRWDYVFTFKRQGLEPQARKVSAFFKGNLLERLDADVLPTEAEFVASLDSGRRGGKIPELVATEESLARFTPDASKAAAAASAAAKPLPPLPSSYPPLEPATR